MSSHSTIWRPRPASTGAGPAPADAPVPELGGKPAVTLVDYSIGNPASIANMLRYLGIGCRRTSDPDEIATANRVILPGVGAFDAGMRAMAEHGMVDAVRHAALERGVPVLGICLGMQLLMDGSEEGSLAGLGLLPGHARRLQPGGESPLKVPHMGWAPVQVVGPGALFEKDGQARFYFVHSYHVVCDEPRDVAAVALYGIRFTAAVERGNLFGVQFHPEKSHRFGMALLKTFASVPST